MTLSREQSGQVLIELGMMLAVLCVFVLGVIDLSRAIYSREVMENLAGEGSSMASRTGAGTSTTVQRLITFAGTDLDLSTSGCVIVTAVANTAAQNNPFQVTAQNSQCAISATSKIGCLSGQGTCKSSNATLPLSAQQALQPQQTMYITEVYYQYTSVTPLWRFLQGAIIPTQFYSVAFE